MWPEYVYPHTVSRRVSSKTVQLTSSTIAVHLQLSRTYTTLHQARGRVSCPGALGRPYAMTRKLSWRRRGREGRVIPHSAVGFHGARALLSTISDSARDAVRRPPQRRRRKRCSSPEHSGTAEMATLVHGHCLDAGTPTTRGRRALWTTSRRQPAVMPWLWRVYDEGSY